MSAGELVLRKSLSLRMILAAYCWLVMAGDGDTLT